MSDAGFLGPYPTEAVITTLQANSALRLAGGVADLDTALRQPPNTTPAAYVLREETAKPGDYAEHGRQRVAVTVKVVLWVRHVGDATGARAEADMTTLERSVRQSLIGYQPAGTRFEPLTLRASGADQFFAGHLVRQVLFETHYIATEATP